MKQSTLREDIATNGPQGGNYQPVPMMLMLMLKLADETVTYIPVSCLVLQIANNAKEEFKECLKSNKHPEIKANVIANCLGLENINGDLITPVTVIAEVPDAIMVCVLAKVVADLTDFRCDICGRNFDDFNKLTQHRKNVRMVQKLWRKLEKVREVWEESYVQFLLRLWVMFVNISMSLDIVVINWVLEEETVMHVRKVVVCDKRMANCLTMLGATGKKFGHCVADGVAQATVGLAVIYVSRNVFGQLVITG